MKKFEQVALVAEDNEKSMALLMKCVQIAMKQYSPDLATDKEKLEEIMKKSTIKRGNI